jgi:SAM-dependent methyltransferase
VPANISYGPNVADDAELRLVGDLSGKRVIELGISPTVNSVLMALAGAKSIAVDPSAERIAAGRAAADREGARVEFHHGDLADLGFVTSASVDLVVAAGSLGTSDDLARVFRQVHRVLRTEMPFIMSVPHPINDIFDSGDGIARRTYGSAPGRSIGELFTSLHRTNFRIDTLHELFDRGRGASPLIPAVLLLRARKLGV